MSELRKYINIVESAQNVEEGVLNKVAGAVGATTLGLGALAALGSSGGAVDNQQPAASGSLVPAAEIDPDPAPPPGVAVYEPTERELWHPDYDAQHKYLDSLEPGTPEYDAEMYRAGIRMKRRYELAPARMQARIDRANAGISNKDF